MWPLPSKSLWDQVAAAFGLFFEDKAWQGFTRGTFHNSRDFVCKLRDAEVSLILRTTNIMSPDTSPMEVGAVCRSRINNQNEFIPWKKLDSIHECKDYLSRSWNEIIKQDTAKIGNLDDFAYFDYLDVLFKAGRQMRSVENDLNRILTREEFNRYLSIVYSEIAGEKFNRESIQKDLSKLLVEKRTLDAYIREHSKQTGDIDDAIYLAARSLIEGHYSAHADVFKRVFARLK